MSYRAGLAVLLLVSISGCTAARLAWRAGPVDCRDFRGVPMACPSK